MIKFLEHNKIDKQKWDVCIDASVNANIFVCSWYLDIVAENWCALVLNDYEAVFPLAPGSKYKINYLYQPFFSRYFGVYSNKAISAHLVDQFFHSIPEQYRFIEFCITEKNEFKRKDFKITERKFQSLDLSQSYHHISADYNDNTKRSIKKALKSGCTVREGIKGAEVVSLFRKTKGRELEVFSAKDYQKLVRIMDECEKKGAFESIGIYNKEGELDAAGFFMKYKNRYVFLKSGVSGEGKSYGYMHLLFDMFIKKHSGAGILLDFGGSSVESVARFYKNFGAKDCVYLQVQRNRLPKLLNWLKSIKK